MINTPIGEVFSNIKKQMDKCLSSLERAEIRDVVFVKTERIVWTSNEGFYGEQDKKIKKSNLGTVIPANKFVFVDRKYCYVFFDGVFGYRFRLKELNPVKMEEVKSFGEPVTLVYAKDLLAAEEIKLGQKQANDNRPKPERSTNNDKPNQSDKVSKPNNEAKKPQVKKQNPKPEPKEERPQGKNKTQAKKPVVKNERALQRGSTKEEPSSPFSIPKL